MTSHAINVQVAPRRVRAMSLSRLAIHATLILACAVYLVPLRMSWAASSSKAVRMCC